MPIPGYPERPVVRQRLFTSPAALAVQLTPTQINNDPSLYQTYVIGVFISVPAAGGNVYLGSAGVSVATGLELVAGAGPVGLSIENERIQYEMLDPLLQLASIANCQNPKPQTIPVIVWDMSQMFLVAPVVTNVAIGWVLAEFI